jgi:hypothetical protein
MTTQQQLCTQKSISQDSSYLRNTVVDMIDKDSDSQIEYHELP